MKNHIFLCIIVINMNFITKFYDEMIFFRFLQLCGSFDNDDNDFVEEDFTVH